jgi:ADP-ribose pyrophosphatase
MSEPKILFNGKVFKVEAEPTRGHEIVRHPGSVAVIPILGCPEFVKSTEIMLCKQFRPAVHEETYEIVAGTRDVPGELPTETVIREMHEEILMHPEFVSPLGFIWPSPGYSNERITLFVAWKLQPWAGEKHEVDRVEKFTVEEVMEMISSGKICDAKTIAAMMYWQMLSCSVPSSSTSELIRSASHY